METSDQRGLILLLILFPLCLILVMGLGVAGLAGNIYVRNQVSCRQYVLRAQIQMRRRLVELFSLNEQATYLRARRQAAEIEVVATIAQPVAHAMAQMKLAQIIAKQFLFAAKQKKILVSGPFEASSELSKLNTFLRNNEDKIGVIRDFRPLVPRLAVQPRPSNSITPSYYPVFHFSSRQELGVRWRALIHLIIPQWINGFIKIRNGNNAFNIACHATIHSGKGRLWGKNQWQVRLSLGKFSLNY